MAHHMNVQYEEQTEKKTAEESLREEFERLKNVLRSERAQWVEERLRAREIEETLRDDLDKLKKMFVTYDEAIRETELLKRYSKQKTNNSNACVSQKDARKEKVLLKEIERLNKDLQSERTKRTKTKEKMRENEKQLREELQRVKRRLMTHERCIKKCEVLENQNLELGSLLRWERSLTAELQLEASETQEDFIKLQQERKEMNALLECESKTNTDLQVMIQQLKEKPERQEKTTEGESSRDYEDHIKALRADIAALQEENSKLQKPNSSRQEEEEVVKREEVEEEVRAEPAPESPQVSCERTDELPATPMEKKKRRPSRWRRFTNLFACGSRHVESEDE